ncbi:MAG: hypothetical protein LBQ96_06795 [Fusobacteriaceae bacterium]|jgi:hypothetical protein|nr:hypothetical protein [Fusobacteriaceae bacterium]
MIAEFKHPEFARKKIVFDIGYFKVRCRQGDTPSKFRRTRGFPVTDNKGDERFLVYRDPIIQPPYVKVDGRETVKLFDRIPNLAWTFVLTEMLIFFTFPLWWVIKGLIELMSFIYLRNNYLSDRTGKRKLVHSILCIIVTGVFMVLVHYFMLLRARGVTVNG